MTGRKCSICKQAMTPITRPDRFTSSVVAFVCMTCDRRKCGCGHVLRLGTEQTCPHCGRPTCPQR